MFYWLEMSNSEKRKHERYGLELPIIITWKDGSGHSRRATGTTSNISSSGAFIICDSPIGKGCAIDLQIDLPIAFQGFITSRISASARVVRGMMKHQPNGGYGHGIMFDHYSFTRL
jgi:hypothetical protein